LDKATGKEMKDNQELSIIITTLQLLNKKAQSTFVV
jgi:hypothetical protein